MILRKEQLGIFLVLMFLVFNVGAQLRVGDAGVEFDLTKLDDDYPEMKEWIKAGVQGGIPDPSTVDIKMTISPTDGSGIFEALTLLSDSLDEGESGQLTLLDGIYELSKPLLLKSNIRLVGESKEGVVLRALPTEAMNNSNAILYSFCEYTGLENLTIEGYYKGEIPNDFTMENTKPDFITDMVVFPSNSKNCWIQNCNILNSGNSAISSWKCSYITIRDNYIERSFNKGGGGRGYVQLAGDHMLLYNNTVRKMRHLAIQREGAEYIVVYKNYLEQDVNFHNADAGRNLVERNVSRLPEGLLPGWHSMMGPWSIRHNNPGPRTAIYGNDCIEFNNGGIRSYSGFDTVFIPARFEWEIPFDRSTNIPEGGTFYPVSNVDEAAVQDVRPTFDRFLLYTIPDGKGTIERTPNLNYTIPNEKITLTAKAEAGQRFRHWEGDIFSLQNPLTVTSDRNLSVKAVFTNIAEVKTWTETFEKYLSTNASGVLNGDQNFDWNYTGEIVIEDNQNRMKLSEGQEVRAIDIPGGIQDISFFVSRLTGVEGRFQVYVNDILVGDSTFSGTGEFLYELEGIDVGSAFDLRIVNGTTEEASFTIDNISWTGYDADATTLSVQSIDGEVINNKGRDQFSPEEEITVTALPNPGKKFVRWIGDVESEQNPVLVSMDKNISITATYADSAGVFEFKENFSKLSGIVNNYEGNYGLNWLLSGEFMTVSTNGNAVQLSTNQSIVSPLLSRGLTQVEVTFKNQFGFGLNRQLDLVINGVVVDSVITNSNEEVIWTSKELNYIDPVKFELRNSSTASDVRLAIDQIKWFNHDGIERFTVGVKSDLDKVIVEPNLEKYEKGTVVKVSVKDDDWLSFNQWVNGFDGNDESFEFVVDQDTLIQPDFDFVQFKTKIDPATVSLNGTSYQLTNDLDFDTYWNVSNANEVVEIELPKAKTIRGVHIAWLEELNTSKRFKVTTSLDKVNYIQLLATNILDSESSVQSFDVEREAKYIRLSIDNPQGTTKVAEFFVSGDVEDPLSSNDELNSLVKLYPNPTQDRFTITAPQHLLQGQSIEIYDLTGHLVHSVPVGSNGKATIDLVNVPKGFYLVKVSSEQIQYNERVLVY